MAASFPPEKRGSGLRSILVVAIVLAGALVGLFVLFNASRIQPNEEGRLDSSGNLTFVATSSRAFDMMMQAAQQPGITQLEQLRKNGQVLLAPSGTRVRVIGIDADRTRILILDGPYANATGYVPPSYVHR